MDATSSQVQVSKLMDRYLHDTLGLPISQGHLEVVERQQLGDVTHTFSHIQLTLRVERLLLKVHEEWVRRIDTNLGCIHVTWRLRSVADEVLAAGHVQC